MARRRSRVDSPFFLSSALSFLYFHRDTSRPVADLSFLFFPFSPSFPPPHHRPCPTVPSPPTPSSFLAECAESLKELKINDAAPATIVSLPSRQYSPRPSLFLPSLLLLASLQRTFVRDSRVVHSLQTYSPPPPIEDRIDRAPIISIYEYPNEFLTF